MQTKNLFNKLLMVAMAALTSATPIDWSHRSWRPVKAAQEYEAAQPGKPSWSGHHPEFASLSSMRQHTRPTNWTETSTQYTDHPGHQHENDHHDASSMTGSEASVWRSKHNAHSGPAPTDKPSHPAKTTEASTWATEHPGVPSPAPTLSSSFSVETDHAASIWERDAADITTWRNLVPTGTTVDIGTDTTGIRTISPLFMPTKVAVIGVTTSGCVVSISDYSYVTSCSGGVRATAAAATPPAITACCGGQDSLYPCMEDGRMPMGESRWVCTMGGSSFAGTRFATTTWV